MRAILLDKPAPIESQPLRLAEVETPKPGTGEILVKVAACGVCRSNLHMIEGDWVAMGVPAKSPIIPGHEIAGRVAAVGAGVTQWKPGDRVGVQPLWWSCGHCEYCLTGREQLCLRKQITGETVDGGYAEYVVAMAEHAYPVPDVLDDAEAAPLFCPGITAYHAIKKAHLAPEKSVAIFGIGGVGHMALQFAKLYSGEVIAVDRNQRHLRLAAEDLGVERTLDLASGDAGATLRAGGGVDAAIVFAPSSAVLRQAARAVKPGGILVYGVHAEVGEVPFTEEKALVGSLLGNRQEMLEVLQLAAAGKIKAICESFPLEKAGEALRLLKQGQIPARAVLVL
ncbi:MAG TPA: alcohol dehydrogenase catalytic domain-containing protein [Thermoanaerobaculia bacterium]|nr:alcohol dehydrogenase catalytic domain-containing protein [Thermoanaerobaculia bacterium]